MQRTCGWIKNVPSHDRRQPDMNGSVILDISDGKLRRDEKHFGSKLARTFSVFKDRLRLTSVSNTDLKAFCKLNIRK